MKDLKEWREILSVAGAKGNGVAFDVAKTGSRHPCNKHGLSSRKQYVKFDLEPNANIEMLIGLVVANGGEAPAIGRGFVEFWTMRDKKIADNQRVIHNDGQSLTVSQAASIVGLPASTILNRIYRGKDPLAPKQKPGRKKAGK